MCLLIGVYVLMGKELKGDGDHVREGVDSGKKGKIGFMLPGRGGRPGI